MSKYFSLNKLLVLLSVLLAATAGLSSSVTTDMIEKAAENQLKMMQSVWSRSPYFDGSSPTISHVIPLQSVESDEPLGYIAELSPKGFIVFSATTDISPVIAYSYESNFPWVESSENILLDMVRKDLSLRNKALSESAVSHEQIAADNRAWSKYLSGNAVPLETKQWPEPGYSSTTGWVKTAWDQGPPYSNYCPKDPRNGERCVVGCVATAMAMIVDYHSDRRDYIAKFQFGSSDRYVSHRTSPPINIDADSITYNFPSFNKLNEYISTLREQYISNAYLNMSNRAALNFACGITVRMGYGYDGSGSFTNRVAGALVSKFGYKSATVMTSGFYPTLSKNMKDSLPAELGIQGTQEGHAIICDGLREIDGQQDQYHLNFGWGGSSPDPMSAAWYVLPSMPAGYSIIDEVVVNIYPPDLSYQPDNLISLSPDNNFIGDGIYDKTGNTQKMFLPMGGSAPSVYYVKVQNDGDLDATMKVTVSKSGSASATIKCYDNVSGTDITSSATDKGWFTPALKPGKEKIIRIEITSSSSSDTCNVDVLTVAKEDEAFKDMIRITNFTGIEEDGRPLSYPLSISSRELIGNSSVNLDYTLPQSCFTSVNIYDASGRLVRNLIKKTADAGLNTTSWDTRDNDSQKVSPGTYFIILRADGKSATTKVVITR